MRVLSIVNILNESS